jgi:hypothetical protein
MVTTMAQPYGQAAEPTRHEVMVEVAARTLGAAHRRDHEHEAVTAACHPHEVEVVHLGDRAAMVCHDCRQDSGFLPHREAEHLAHEHRLLTTGELTWPGDIPTNAA